MKEEDKLLRKVGTGNPFTVPEGYFDNLASEVMEKLPEKEMPKFVQKEITMWDKVKPWLYMAAMFVGAALIIRVASNDDRSVESKPIAAVDTATEIVSDQYIDYALSQAMLDDYSLYELLSGSSENGINN